MTNMTHNPSPTPIVSVVMPVYNCADYVGEALQSILSQDLKDLEIICVDDGSTDGSGEIIKAVADDRIRYVWQENSGRPSIPRNVGLRLARGRYVAIFDSDDVMLPGKLRDSVESLKAAPSVAMVFTDFYRLEEDRGIDATRFLAGYPYFHSLPKARVSDGAFVIGAQDMYRGLAFENFVGTSSVVLRKSAAAAVGGFDESLPNGDDRDLWFRLSAHWDAIFIDRPLHLYRVRSGAISRRGASNALARIRVLQKQVVGCSDRVIARQLRRGIAENLAGLGYDAKRRGDFRAAKGYFVRAILLQPSWSGLRRLVGAVLRVNRASEWQE